MSWKRDEILEHTDSNNTVYLFFLFISRRQKRTKDSKALKRPYKSRVYTFLLSMHVSRAWREHQEGCIIAICFFYCTLGDIIWKTKHRILKGSFFYCKNHSESLLVEQRNYGS